MDIYPRYEAHRRQKRARCPPYLIWKHWVSKCIVILETLHWLVFGGLALRVVIEPLAERGAGGPLGGLLAVSGVAQAAVVLIFVGGIWSRVRGIGKEA